MCPDEQIVFIYNSTKPVLMITENHPPVLTRFICIGRVIHRVTINKLWEVAGTMSADPKITPLVEYEPPCDLTAAIYYTSGTTGHRKGVRLRHR
jgi:long-subunit acyl-CoA synthetase (AMP-forming)